MGMNRYIASIDAVALAAAATAKTFLELGAPATRQLWIKRWWVEFDGTSPTEKPILVEVFRCSGGITGTIFTAADIKMHPNAKDPLTVAKHTATAEGTPGTIQGRENRRISPNSYGTEYTYPLGDEFYVDASGFWRLRLTIPSAGAAVNATCGVIWEE